VTVPKFEYARRARQMINLDLASKGTGVIHGPQRGGEPLTHSFKLTLDDS